MKKAILILFLAAGFTAEAQNFEKIYPYWEEGNIWAVIAYDDGYALAGFNAKSYQDNYMFIIRTDLNGDTLWTKQLDVGNGGHKIGYIRAYAIDEDGNIYMSLGYSDSADLIKFSPDWDVVWKKIFTPRHFISNITLASDGNLLISADTSSTNQVLIKTDTEANILWSAPHTALSQTTYTPSILEGSHGVIIKINTTLSVMDPDPAFSTIYSYSSQGNFISEGFIDNGIGYGRILGNAFLAGNNIRGIAYTLSGSSMIEYLSDGTLLWEKPMKLPTGYYANHIIYGADSSIVATNLYEWSVKNSILLYGTNLAGDSLWTRIAGTENPTFGLDVRLCPDGGFALVGCTEIDGINKPYFLKTDSKGNIGNVGIIEKNSPGEIKVYPNPANDYVVFESPDVKSGIISIVDIYGRNIAQIPVTRDKTVWDARVVAPGVYLYQIKNGKLSATGKLMKVR